MLLRVTLYAYHVEILVNMHSIHASFWIGDISLEYNNIIVPVASRHLLCSPMVPICTLHASRVCDHARCTEKGQKNNNKIIHCSFTISKHDRQQYCFRTRQIGYDLYVIRVFPVLVFRSFAV